MTNSEKLAKAIKNSVSDLDILCPIKDSDWKNMETLCKAVKGNKDVDSLIRWAIVEIAEDNKELNTETMLARLINGIQDLEGIQQGISEVYHAEK